MGQYYRIAVGDLTYVRINTMRYVNSENAEEDASVYNKMMEHAYIGNPLTDAATNFLYNSGSETGKWHKVMWCGDYAHDSEIRSLTEGSVGYGDIWRGEPFEEFIFPKCGKFDFSGKYFVNHLRKLYVPFDRAMEENSAGGRWRINPVPILTSLGNGRGGGDYFGSNMELVGSWCWEPVEVTDCVPKGYSELEATFRTC